MAHCTLSHFSDRVIEIMPVITREFSKRQISEFYKTRITLPQFVVLDALHRHGESKMTDLARYLDVTTAAVTGIVDRLVRDGHVLRMRDPDDRRVIKVKLTAKGSSSARNITEDRKKTIIKLFGMITQKERDAYLGILEHICGHLK